MKIDVEDQSGQRGGEISGDGGEEGGSLCVGTVDDQHLQQLCFS